jgi:hypothetical protein
MFDQSGFDLAGPHLVARRRRDLRWPDGVKVSNQRSDLIGRGTNKPLMTIVDLHLSRTSEAHRRCPMPT